MSAEQITVQDSAKGRKTHSSICLYFSFLKSPMRSARSRTPVRLCGGKLLLATRPPPPVLLMPQVCRHCKENVFILKLSSVTEAEKFCRFLCHHRSDPAPLQPGRRRPCLMGRSDSHQVRLQELREHSDTGELRENPSPLFDSISPEVERLRLTSKWFSLPLASQETPSPKRRWDRAQKSSPRSSHASDRPPTKQ